MGFLGALGISGSGLTAERLRMDVISSNIANAESTRTQRGGPYRRQQVVFTPLANPGNLAPGGRGVRVSSIVESQDPPRLVYEPGHPDAGPDGNVAYPNVDISTEMVDLLSASRAYEANVTVLNAAKSMAQRALTIVRR
ncbi:MAG: flagellar basal body rod protein FlgC [Chloroflexota bacterium]|nr:MAG: flagellar basal body rod protein FlgC [Chloroflexota bacterium]